MAETYKEPVRIAVIGGTGLRSLPSFQHAATINPTTPWGRPSAPIHIHTHNNAPIAFLARHGLHHTIAPHEIPTRANIAALRSLGVRCVVAFSAVGSLREEIRPEDFVVPDQIIDRTKGVRPFTFFEGGVVGHVGFADPFDLELHRVIVKVGRASGVLERGSKVIDRGTLVCIEGPQFSTRAESNLYRNWGCDVVNMSALPEAKLALEAEMAYSMVCMATDYDCWRETDPGENVTVEVVMRHMRNNAENAKSFLAKVLDALAQHENSNVVLAKHLEGTSSVFVKGGIVTEVESQAQETREKLLWLFGERK
ncbi:MAG: hypothetical protein Q9159_003546 [Coniocarpon cinnabarinum]